MSAPRSDDQLEWEEVMDLWRDDTRRRASRIDPAVMTDRILRQGKSAHEDRAPLRYAAAAVLLIGLGLGGSLLLGAGPQPTADGVSATLRALEDGRLALEGDRASQDFAAAGRPAEEER